LRLVWTLKRTFYDQLADISMIQLVMIVGFIYWPPSGDSVAIALQSCLGSLAQYYCVSFQIHNHFKFTVSCKKVGFAIYKLRRFIVTSLDVYFHLCSSGAPH
jgi:hypothetical protein